MINALTRELNLKFSFVEVNVLLTTPPPLAYIFFFVIIIEMFQLTHKMLSRPNAPSEPATMQYNIRSKYFAILRNYKNIISIFDRCIFKIWLNVGILP